ncbi:hypothetical protein [Halorhodospira halophila]|uniref:DUF4268 domain-containing protein n=1 Tax=Halorhodospira halophila (strain DSM 244 / SL1) TaxID=349124 RepID=A1WW64_HALHL|nr:hypothetical protein [Halorhodospira halophila]ABM61926.1 hypothetical protein Hhal_1150 [Halorhodospira halophila SL1]MBK1729746.1 hypothetical protein [Halorhodospira halophila]
MPNYADMLLRHEESSGFIKARRAPLGFTDGRDEAWLRDLLADNPDVLPIEEIDPSFAPLAPLCTELETEAGPVDAAFINPSGRLTLVECKLWRNPEARRKVIAQILDYARAIAQWDYADLQRRVASASGDKANRPFEAARQLQTDLDEAVFVDATARALREGRFLLLIAGDGIREGVSGMTDLISRNAALGFSFGLVEVALYQFGEQGLAVQPRVIAKTHTIERTFVVMQGPNGAVLQEGEGDADQPSQSRPTEDEVAWWEPLTRIAFNDPEQEPPVYRPRNHVRVAMPSTGMWVTAFRAMSHGICGVFLGGRKPERLEVLDALNEEREQILSELPEGTHQGMDGTEERPGFAIYAQLDDFASDEACRAWLSEQLNRFVNAFRPRLKRVEKR